MNVIVTGASKGIGLAIAEKFAAAGNRLLICARNKGALEEAAASIRLSNPSAEVMVMQADLSDKQQVQSFAAWCLGFGAPDILVNNAGVYLPGNTIDEPEGVLEKMIDTNVYSAYHLTRALLPSMAHQRRGHIFNICSIASLRAYQGGGGYSISKFALYGFSQNLRHELKDTGIKVTSVLPGAVMSDSWGDFDNSKGRIMEASDIADMIWSASALSPQAVVEDIILRPQLGDL